MECLLHLFVKISISFPCLAIFGNYGKSEAYRKLPTIIFANIWLPLAPWVVWKGVDFIQCMSNLSYALPIIPELLMLEACRQNTLQAYIRNMLSELRISILLWVLLFNSIL